MELNRLEMVRNYFIDNNVFDKDGLNDFLENVNRKINSLIRGGVVLRVRVNKKLANVHAITVGEKSIFVFDSFFVCVENKIFSG